MPFYLLLAFLFMVYASPALLFPALAVIRPAQLAALGALVILAARKTLFRETWRSVWPDTYLALGIVAGAGLSCIEAFWPRLAYENTIDLAKMVVIYLLVVNCVDSEKRLKQALVVMVVGGMFPAVGTILNRLDGVVVDGNRAGWLGSFANPNDLAYSLVILIPLAFQLSRGSRWFFKPVLWGILGTYFVAIFASNSRGGMMGAFAVMLVLGFRQPGIPAKVATAAVVAVLTVAAATYWTRDAGFDNLQQDFTVHQRMETILAGLRMFADHPLLGVGLGCSVVAFPFYASANLDFRGALVIHNTMVQALSELGLLGFVPFVVFLGSGITRATRSLRNVPKSNAAWSYAIALETSLVGFLVCGLSGGYLTSWFPYIVIGLASALTMIVIPNRGLVETPVKERAVIDRPYSLGVGDYEGAL